MTLVAAWLRAVRDTEELVVAADSRLSGGLQFDTGPKLFAPIRGDCVLAFAGATYLAYPLMLQILHFTSHYDRARTRAMDLEDFAGHCERLCSELLREAVRISAPIPAGIAINKEFTLLLAGWSWKAGRFRIYESSVSRRGQFRWLTRRCTPDHAIFVGTAKPLAREALYRSFRGKRPGRRFFSRRPVNWQPLDILRDVIRSNADHDTGGPPQVMKVGRHMNVLTYAVPWEVSGKSVITYLGRPLLSYERTQKLLLNTDTHTTSLLWEYLDQPRPLREEP